MGEKAIEAAALLDDLTVILLGRDEPGYAGRAAHYYRARFGRYATVEASMQGATAHAWQAQLLATLDQVDTPFTVLTLDCDFLLVDAAVAAVQALRVAPQYLMAQGYTLGYRPGNSDVGYYKIGSALPGSASANSGRERIQLHGEHGLHAWRAVVRVEALKAVVRDAPLDLPFEGWSVAVSYGLLAQGAVKVLAQTGVIAEHSAQRGSQVMHEEQLNRAISLLRQWDAEHGQLCADAKGFDALSAFVRKTHDSHDAPLLFRSHWAKVSVEPERTFEPRQFVEMPYYNAALFGQLRALEFLVHGWPAGRVHSSALEGVWVRQQALMAVHPNDTVDSLKERYWQAFALGLFNRQVCQRLVDTLNGKDDLVLAEELRFWLEQLNDLQGSDIQPLLEATPSGKVIAAIAAATPDSAARQRVLAHLAKKRSPQIAFLVVDLDNSDSALQATFDSLLASGLRDFKIVVLKVGELPAITTAKDTLHFIKVTPGNLIAHLNQVSRQLSSDWLMLLQAGDMLTTGGLLRLQVELGGAEACQAICANEVQRDSEGRLLSVVRPGCNLDLLRNRPDLMSRHWLVRRETLLELGGYSETCAQALEFDLLLRLSEQHGIAGMAHLDEYLVVGQQAPETMGADALSTLKRHLTTLGYRGQVNVAEDGAFQIDFRHPATPQVSVLLPAGEDLAQLQACLASIVQRTRYTHYEVLVVSDTANAESVAARIASIQGLGGRIRLLSCEQGLTGAEMINQAALQARGEYLLLMSARSQVVSPAWIEALLNQALRPEVGVVGVQMYGRDDMITHAGYELLASQQVRGSWLGVSRHAAESVPGLAAVRSCQAVSGECLMVRKELFEHCAGLEAIAGADVDLCLKAAEAGLLVVWTPMAQMLNAGIAMLEEAQVQALVVRWPAAFTTRSHVDRCHGVDVSRLPAAGKPVELEWLAEVN
ncbi:glycosyltransferase family 2 protein [Pseudomonas sp.]|uniref:glycosyltransferase family 2 protein n=1 Tax=Pseudomonas sp. TaxID=306 RepID=UPI003D6FDEC4